MQWPLTNFRTGSLKYLPVSLILPVSLTPEFIQVCGNSHFVVGFYNAITPNNCFVKGSHKYDVYLVEENKAHLN